MYCTTLPTVHIDIHCSCLSVGLQERSLERLPALSPNIACNFVRLVELLLGLPPRLDCLRNVCDHLLVSDINDLKLVAGPAQLETSISALDGEHLQGLLSFSQCVCMIECVNECFHTVSVCVCERERESAYMYMCIHVHVGIL